MATDPDARRAAFTAFVRRGLDHARINKGLSIPQLAKVSGIGQNTLYSWQAGNWREYPKGELVEKFCDALDIPTSAAFSILWPGRGGRPPAPEPLQPEPELMILARKLRDPNVPEQEKFLILETLKGLASRPNAPSDAPKRRSTG